MHVVPALDIALGAVLRGAACLKGEANGPAAALILVFWILAKEAKLSYHNKDLKKIVVKITSRLC